MTRVIRFCQWGALVVAMHKWAVVMLGCWSWLAVGCSPRVEQPKDNPNAAIIAQAQLIQRAYLRPGSPPPAKSYAEADVTGLESAIEVMLDITDAQLVEHRRAITENIIYSFSSAEDFAIIRDQTMARYYYADALYQAYRPLREAVLRQDLKAYGLSKALMTRINNWLQLNVGNQAVFKEFCEWNWDFGDFYPLLRHRLVVLQGEACRQGLIEDITDARQQTLDGYYSIFDLDLEPYEPDVIQKLEHLQLQAWVDVLTWGLLSEDFALTFDMHEIRLDLEGRYDVEQKLQSSDATTALLWGHLCLVMARLDDAGGRKGDSVELLRRVIEADNVMATSAWSWIRYLAAKRVIR